MSAAPLKLLVLADTHLGFDAPRRPRIERPRRGGDFARNFALALAPALRGEVDLVLHGGDLLYRSRVPPTLVEQALAPLRAVAAAGVPVFLVPGNHERSHIPHGLLARAERLTVFAKPNAVVVTVRGARVQVVGFPCARDGVRDGFAALLDATRWRDQPADVRLLLLHQTIEGARVGPVDYCFRGGPDVIRGGDLPRGLDAVLAGHIHRHQVLTHDLRGRPFAAPVLYPGSIERTAMAERDEPKGYLRIEVTPSPRALSWRFEPLPVRPMHRLVLEVGAGDDGAGLAARAQAQLRALEPDAVVQLVLVGEPTAAQLSGFGAAQLRALAQPGQIVELVWPAAARRSPRSQSPCCRTCP